MAEALPPAEPQTDGVRRRFFAITGGSWGLQIGVEGVDLVMIIQNERVCSI